LWYVARGACVQFLNVGDGSGHWTVQALLDHLAGSYRSALPSLRTVVVADAFLPQLQRQMHAGGVHSTLHRCVCLLCAGFVPMFGVWTFDSQQIAIHTMMCFPQHLSLSLSSLCYWVCCVSLRPSHVLADQG
jgi:hypothetical protein